MTNKKSCILNDKYTLYQTNMGSKYKEVFIDILHIQVVSKFSPIQIQIAPLACVMVKIKSIDLSRSLYIV